MSRVYLCSDLHLGHKNIHKFRCVEKGFELNFANEKEHREWILYHLNHKTNKRDVVYMLGDIAFNEEALLDLKKIPCRKILVKGNHCVDSPLENEVFEKVLGLTRYRGVWLSHAPIHPVELRGKPNFHGHVHYCTLKDSRYQNCCIEEFMKIFNKPIVSFEEVRQYRESNTNDIDKEESNG